MEANKYDIAIIGGGLAGLTLSTQLVRAGFTVILIEKEVYPFHKVCGEYISMESWQHLIDLGLALDQMGLPKIKQLVVTAPSGTTLSSPLDLGGFGISRFKIDHELKNIAVTAGVVVKEQCKGEPPEFDGEHFTLKTNSGIFYSKVCCGSFGKRSNIDLKWNRRFAASRKNKLNNYVGVKYHIKTNTDTNIIALHNFERGYCGISAIEDNMHCLCYLTNAENLVQAGSIEQLEKKILSKNPHLRKIFEESVKLTPALTISQISFDKKSQVEEHVLLLGDAAGMITPLCGNGMSMAIHAGKIASGHISSFLLGKVSRREMEINYSKDWDKQFSGRLAAGRMIQRFFGKAWQTNIFVALLQKVPWITRKLIAQTHGKPF